MEKSQNSSGFWGHATHMAPSVSQDLEEIRSALGREEIRSTQLREEAALFDAFRQPLKITGICWR